MMKRFFIIMILCLIAGVLISSPCSSVFAQGACTPGWCPVCDPVCRCIPCGGGGVQDVVVGEPEEEEIIPESNEFISEGGKVDFSVGNIGIFTNESRKGEKFTITIGCEGAEIRFFDENGKSTFPSGVTYLYFNIDLSSNLANPEYVIHTSESGEKTKIETQFTETDSGKPRAYIIITEPGAYRLDYGSLYD